MFVGWAAGCADPITEPVACDGLPDAPEAFPASADVVEHLPPGSARVEMEWVVDGVVHHALVRRTSAEAMQLPASRWSIRADIDCDPDLSVALIFQLAGGASVPEEGAYPVVEFSADVPGREQTTVSESVQVEGQMVVVDVGAARMSGYLDGQASGAMQSLIPEVDVGDRTLRVTGLAFNQIPM